MDEFNIRIRESVSKPYWYIEYETADRTGMQIAFSVLDAIEHARNIYQSHNLNKYVTVNSNKAFDITDDNEVFDILMLYSDC